jgi:hypothetical protein
MALATSIPIILFFIVGLCCSGKITSNGFGLDEGGDFHHPPRRIDAEN